jgi:HK97 family phage major capsid protein
MHLQRNAMLRRPRPFEIKEGTDNGRTSPEIKNLEDLKSEFLKQHRELQSFIVKANAEIAASGTASAETKAAMVALTESLNTVGTRLDKIEAKGNRLTEQQNDQKSLGQLFTECAEYKAMATGGAKRGRMEVKQIVNASGTTQPLVAPERVPEIVFPAMRKLRIRNMLRVGQTISNIIFFPQELVYTDLAGPQAGGSPTAAGENILKNESNITFQFATAPVVTIAHFILASRQVLEDAPMLQSYIDGRLSYALALEEERELLNGDGSDGGLVGLMAQATGYDASRQGGGSTKIDTLRMSMTQLYLSEYFPEFVVLNPIDWESIELLKDTLGRYIIGNPLSDGVPRIWGLPVIVTNSQVKGQFLTANGTLAAQIWDRMQAAIELSREDSDNFRRNMVTILTEERLALTVYRPQALIKGVFTD